jgi:hypothetical protein
MWDLCRVVEQASDYLSAQNRATDELESSIRLLDCQTKVIYSLLAEFTKISVMSAADPNAPKN